MGTRDGLVRPRVQRQVKGVPKEEPKPVWYRVEAPHFVAGIKFNGQKCVDAAPILSWCLGGSKGRILNIFKSKGYKVEELD